MLIAELRELLRDAGQRGAGRNSDQDPLFARSAPRHVFRRLGLDGDDSVEDRVSRMLGTKFAPRPWIG